MNMPQMREIDRDQAITNLIQALAMQEAAIASLIQAEAGTIDALVQAGIPQAVSIQQVVECQAAVAQVLQVTAEKQQSMNTKLEQIRALVMACQKEMPNP